MPTHPLNFTALKLRKGDKAAKSTKSLNFNTLKLQDSGRAATKLFIAKMLNKIGRQNIHRQKKINQHPFFPFLTTPNLSVCALPDFCGCSKLGIARSKQPQEKINCVFPSVYAKLDPADPAGFSPQVGRRTRFAGRKRPRPLIIEQKS